jgi:hypothetical protein
LDLKTSEKAGARKWTSLVRFQPQLFAGQISFNLKQTFQQIDDNEGVKKRPKLDPPTFDFKRIYFLTFLKHVSFARRSKNWTPAR